MLLQGKFEVRGQSDKVSAKGNAYKVVSLEQGAETKAFMTSKDLSTLKGQNIIAHLEYNPVYNTLQLVDYELCK